MIQLNEWTFFILETRNREGGGGGGGEGGGGGGGQEDNSETHSCIQEARLHLRSTSFTTCKQVIT